MMAIVIGGSAGALQAMSELFATLRDTAEVKLAAFAVVLHISPTSRSLLPEVIGGYTHLRVREAIDKLPLEVGTVTVAPPDYHMLIERDGSVALSRDPAVHFSRPAIDPLFESAALAFGARAIGVLLSGANDDGAAGLRAIRAAGGQVIVQDPTTATSAEMPTAGIASIAPSTPELVGAPRALGSWLTSALGGSR